MIANSEHTVGYATGALVAAAAASIPEEVLGWGVKLVFAFLTAVVGSLGYQLGRTLWVKVTKK